MGHLNLQVIKTLYPPQYDLVDLTVTTSYIWSLWTDSNNETKLLYSAVNRIGNCPDTPGLKLAHLEAFPEKEVPITDPSVDPSEMYLKLLLAPNKFSAVTLQKALGIYKHNIDMNHIHHGEGNRYYSGLWKLAHEVETALKNEIQSRIFPDMTEGDIAEIKLNAWATFYSHTLQYHQVCRKAVSIVPVGGEGLVGVMRKRSISWIRPLDALELLTLSSQTTSCITALTSTPILDEDASVATTAIALARPLDLIRQALDSEVAVAFCQDLLHLESPDQVALSIATSLLSGIEGYELDEPLGRAISRQVSGLSGIIPGLQAYLRALQLDLGNPDALTIEGFLNGSHSNSTPQWLSGAFSSRMGASILTAVVSQLAQHRLGLCRDLFLLQHILLKLNILSPEDKNRIHSTLLSQTTLLTQAYFALMKVSSAPATIPSASCLETSRRQLAALSLTESNFFYSSSIYPATTLELFVLSIGGQHARALVASSLEERNGTSWAHLLMPLATTVAQLAWPISKCLILVEFLVWGCQHSSAQEYIRLLQHWCEWNSYSRMFLYGISLLNQGEAWKAHKLLLKASEGVAIEEFLGSRVAGGIPELSLKETQVQYCLKIIRLLEQSGYAALALEIAKAGVTLASTGDPGLASLYSVAFKYHLELGHHDEAFTAMMACPDEHSRRNCLRQLIITLYDRKCLSTLVKFNYGTLEPEVILILENRARSADILVNNYYDLLFAFHVSKHNYKKAAWAMYECAVRLNVEGLGEKGLELQAKCYLASLNCLNHIPVDQAWIIKPLSKNSENENQRDDTYDDSGHKTLKQLKKSKKRPQVEVLELTDIEKEYQLVHARLKLYKSQGLSLPLPGGPMSPPDTVSLLVHVKLFREGIKLCHLYDLPLEPVFEGLATACIEADRSPDQADQLNWVAQNGISRDKSETASWWSLLRLLLEEEEKGNKSYLHKSVTSIILQKCHTVPAWLMDSYKKRNCGELIRILMCEGLLEDATRLSLNLVDALLGVGTEQMGLDNALHATCPPVYLPYSILDHLLLELKEARMNPTYQKLYSDFDKKIKLYLSTLHAVSQDRLLLLD